jgi:glutamate-5-semialdehyde dehydrogenase
MTRVNLADDENEIIAVARAAKRAARRLACLSTATKDGALEAVALKLTARQDEILLANRADQSDAQALVAKGELAQSLFDRLKLDEQKLAGMIEGVRAVAALADPANRVLARTRLDDGLELEKVSAPLGVLAIIFESRPDAVTQISALALKSGNSLILKGGKEASRTTATLVAAINGALAEISEIPPHAISLLTEREQINALLALDQYIDLVIPRGSNELVRYIQSNTRIPVLGHAEGICHIYIDETAQTEMACDIVFDSKLQYPAACNAVETLLVHAAAAPRILPVLLARLAAADVELRVCPRTRTLAPQLARVLKPAHEQDWQSEYCAPILSIKIVDTIDEAIDHINLHGSGHTDAIISEDQNAARLFLNSVDAAGVYHNASTRFADGYRYGFGAEVGISTSKLHARGPVGLAGLVSYKYKLYGSGQLVASYCGARARAFRHEDLPL